jgi:hypothetical protein
MEAADYKTVSFGASFIPFGIKSIFIINSQRSLNIFNSKNTEQTSVLLAVSVQYILEFDSFKIH